MAVAVPMAKAAPSKADLGFVFIITTLLLKLKVVRATLNFL